MVEYVYILTIEEPWEASIFVGAFTSQKRAKDTAERRQATDPEARTLVWEGHQGDKYTCANINRRETYEITRHKLNPSPWEESEQ